ncbi:hypothetical protein N9082_01050 [Akkermansiaceae bacterium]|nr:hypothetical protein [Akkermansiaceae bacterium]
MKKLSLALSLAFGTTAFAEVPALINYQGRLVDEVGNPIVGKKEFKLDIYDSQTEGTLIYQETLPEITLDEDGAYSFQFGAGESRSETSVVIATGDGEAAFFQKVFEQTPVGVISVTDGTNTFKTGDVPTGEEPFSFTYTASLKRLNLVCNEPPAEGVNFTATFRYAESGIMGALGSATEHWMEVTIGGEKQEPRQRLVAVPFALKALSIPKKRRKIRLNTGWTNVNGVPRFLSFSSGQKTTTLSISSRDFQTITISSIGPNSPPSGNAYRYLNNGDLTDTFTGVYLKGWLSGYEGSIIFSLESRSEGQSLWQTEWQKTRDVEDRVSEEFEIRGDALSLLVDGSNKDWRVKVSWGVSAGSVHLESCGVVGE